MKILKKIIKSKFVRKLACKLVYLYIKFLLLTSKVRITYKDFDYEEYKDKQCIFVVWHGRVLIMPSINSFSLPASGLVSDHSDGRLIGEVIKHSGVNLIYGSSNRNQLSSIKEILKCIKEGHNFMITPDGPRGPAREVHGAIINIASTSGLPIIPASCSAKSAKFFNSWDNFMLPYPFNDISIIFGKPIYIPKKIDQNQKEEYRKTVQDSINEMTAIADSQVRS